MVKAYFSMCLCEMACASTCIADSGQCGWMDMSNVGRCYVRLLPENVMHAYAQEAVRLHLCVVSCACGVVCV